jgi:hypothetical protein
MITYEVEIYYSETSTHPQTYMRTKLPVEDIKQLYAWLEAETFALPIDKITLTRLDQRQLQRRLAA